jgi:hypothetical protein
MGNSEKSKHSQPVAEELWSILGLPGDIPDSKPKNRPIGDDGELITPDLTPAQERALRIIGVDCLKYRATLYWCRRTMETIATTIVIARLAVPENTAFFLSIITVYATLAFMMLTLKAHQITDKFSAIYREKEEGSFLTVAGRKKAEIVSALVAMGLSEQFVRSHFGTITKIFQARERDLQAQEAQEKHQASTRQRLGLDTNDFDGDDDLESDQTPEEDAAQRAEVLRRLTNDTMNEEKFRRARMAYLSSLPPVNTAAPRPPTTAARPPIRPPTPPKRK